MWKHTSKSVRGSAHVVNGLPCQDASGSILVADVLICALSDGCGSAKLSHLGSKLIVDECLQFFRGYFSENENCELSMRDLGRDQGEWVIDSVRKSIMRIAIEHKEAEHEFAGTLLVAVVSKNRAVFYQVGDGVWCVCKSGVIGAVTWPEQGEFAGQTVFVTSSSAISSIQCEAVEGSIDYIVGITDGLERLSLDLQGRVPHLGFWSPLIAALRNAESIDEFSSNLEIFLSSPRVCDRTDDDKSLVLIAHENGV